jgi:hypothetical protein
VEDSLLRRLVGWSFSFHFYGLLLLNLSSHAITVELREGAANVETGGLTQFSPTSDIRTKSHDVCNNSPSWIHFVLGLHLAGIVATIEYFF